MNRLTNDERELLLSIAITVLILAGTMAIVWWLF